MNKSYPFSLFILFSIVAIAIAIPFSINTSFQTVNINGTFHFANNGKNSDLGFVEDENDPAITFTTHLNPTADSKDITFFPNGVPAENQQVKLTTVFMSRKNQNLNEGRYFSLVQITGPVANNIFRFFPANGDEDIIIYNFDYLEVSADLKSVEVSKDGKVSVFVDGHWGYRSNSKSPIVANDGVAGYLTKGGFGSVCTTISADCPYTSVELYENTDEHWVYYPQYQHAIIVTP